MLLENKSNELLRWKVLRFNSEREYNEHLSGYMYRIIKFRDLVEVKEYER